MLEIIIEIQLEWTRDSILKQTSRVIESFLSGEHSLGI